MSAIDRIKSLIEKGETITKEITELDDIAKSLLDGVCEVSVGFSYKDKNKEKENILDEDGSLISNPAKKYMSAFEFFTSNGSSEIAKEKPLHSIKVDDITALAAVGAIVDMKKAELRQIAKELKNMNIKL